MGGKFLQRANLSQTSIFEDPKKIYELLKNLSVEVTEITPVNKNKILINWHNNPEELPESPLTSATVARYVTAQAWLHLYSFIEQLQDRMIYSDTDGKFFFEGLNDMPLPTGDFLGQLTDKLGKWPNSYTFEFVCGKTYKKGCFFLFSVIFRESKKLGTQSQRIIWQRI